MFQDYGRFQILGSKSKSLDYYQKAVSTRYMNKSVKYQPLDFLITVESGVTIPEILEITKQYNQTVRLDHTVIPFGTVGGRVSIAGATPCKNYIGLVEDQVQWLEFVSPRYGVLSFGATTLKNVAGYHIEKMMVGTMGLIGAVTKVTLKTYPIHYARVHKYLFKYPNKNALMEAKLLAKSRSNVGWLDIYDFSHSEEESLFWALLYHDDRTDFPLSFNSNNLISNWSEETDVHYLLKLIGLDHSYKYNGTIRMGQDNRESYVLEQIKENNGLLFLDDFHEYGYAVLPLGKSLHNGVMTSDRKILNNPMFLELKNLSDPEHILVTEVM